MTDGPTPRVLHVDGAEVSVDADLDEVLLDTLRDRLGVTSARGTCGIGICGTCTVLVDGRVTSSCLMLTAQAEGRAVTTAAGLRDPDGSPGPVQRAFVAARAFQCSFCIPAMAVTVQGALQDPAVPRTSEGIREYLAGNLCRCGSYPEVLDAVADLLEDTDVDDPVDHPADHPAEQGHHSEETPR